MTCPRCGRVQPPSGPTGSTVGDRRSAARYCVHCGRILSGVRWVAAPPDDGSAREPAPGRGGSRRYTGPPAYATIPRWSLWPWAVPVPRRGPGSGSGSGSGRGEGRAEETAAARPAPHETLRSAAILLRPLAHTTVALAVVAALAEGWRYALLLASRDAALSGVVLGWSDVLVTLFGLLAPLFALATAVVFLRWLVAARAQAAELSGTVPARSVRALLWGSVLPPTTLTVPGAALAEIEHAAGTTDPDRLAARPRPSRTVAAWWAAWAAGVVLGLVTFVHGFAGSTQALADGVVLHGIVDVLAAVTALLTVRVVDRLTELLAPQLRSTGRAWVVRVASAA